MKLRKDVQQYVVIFDAVAVKPARFARRRDGGLRLFVVLEVIFVDRGLLWEKAVAFHGHECPGLMKGVRACEAALEYRGFSYSEDEELVCVTETDACGVDAVQAILGCTLGKGNLVYRATGKLAFTFFARNSDRSLRLYCKIRNPGYERKTWQKLLYDMPLKGLFDFQVPTFALPGRARLMPSVVCERCGEFAPENMIRIQDGKQVCVDCYEGYSRGW